jgi:predicted dienelactone hydrolase
MNLRTETESSIRVPTGPVLLEGNLDVPEKAAGIVLFAHGSGSSRHSPRNQAVAAALRADGLGTLLLDLLTPEEEASDERTAELRFDIGFLAERLVDVTDWLTDRNRTTGLPVGYFGASTGGGAALVAAAARLSLRQRRGRKPCAPWSRAAADRTWPVPPSPGSRRRRS